MWDVLGEILKKNGLTTALLLVLIGSVGYVYFNPTDQSKFRTDILGQMQVVQTKYDDLQNKYAVLREENLELKLDMKQMQIQILNLQTVQESLPWPAWLKDTSGKILSANQAYEDWYLKPRGFTLYDYVGQDDYAVWPKDIADSFRENDSQVLNERIVFVFDEELEIRPGERKTYQFIKYPRYVGNAVIGIAGMLVPHPELK